MGRRLVGSIFLETLTLHVIILNEEILNFTLVFLFSTLDHKIPRKQRGFTKGTREVTKF